MRCWRGVRPVASGGASGSSLTVFVGGGAAPDGGARVVRGTVDPPEGRDTSNTCSNRVSRSNPVTVGESSDHAGRAARRRDPTAPMNSSVRRHPSGRRHRIRRRRADGSTAAGRGRRRRRRHHHGHRRRGRRRRGSARTSAAAGAARSPQQLRATASSSPGSTTPTSATTAPLADLTARFRRLVEVNLFGTLSRNTRTIDTFRGEKVSDSVDARVPVGLGSRYSVYTTTKAAIVSASMSVNAAPAQRQVRALLPRRRAESRAC